MALESIFDTPFALYCQTQHEIGQLVHAAHGSIFNTITTGTFSNSRVVLAPEAIYRAFEANVAPFFQAILLNLNESRTLATVRDALLPRLLSGVLRVPDAGRLITQGTT